MLEYSKILTEVDVILNLLSDADYDKIPEELLNVINQNKDKEYIWEYDENKHLKEQNISREALAFLSYISMEYLMNEKQKAYMKNVYETNERKKNLNDYSNSQVDNVEDLFKKRKDKMKSEVEENKSLTIYKISIWNKIKEKIKRILDFKE